jgi:hypothetical protein
VISRFSSNFAAMAWRDDGAAAMAQPQLRQELETREERVAGIRRAASRARRSRGSLVPPPELSRACAFVIPRMRRWRIRLISNSSRI